MKEKLSASLCGFLFALGLGISQMTRPPKILGFLNVFGEWDPTLLVVFAAAAGLYLIFYQMIAGKDIKLLLKKTLPPQTRIDSRLIIGSVCFGIGWGLIGLCPGPALTDLFSLKPSIAIFVSGVVAGSIGSRVFIR